MHTICSWQTPFPSSIEHLLTPPDPHPSSRKLFESLKILRLNVPKAARGRVNTRAPCTRGYGTEIRSLSDTVPLWSGTSYRAFVYIDNDGFCFVDDCKRNNCKDKCNFFRFASNSKEFKKREHLSRLNSLIGTNVIAIVNKKLVNGTVSFDKWASAI